MHIEKNIPAPTSTRGAPQKYPFASMEIGDSIFIQGQNSQGNACMAARQHGYHHGKKFVSRSESGGVRIWRTA